MPQDVASVATKTIEVQENGGSYQRLISEVLLTWPMSLIQHKGGKTSAHQLLSCTASLGLAIS